MKSFAQPLTLLLGVLLFATMFANAQKSTLSFASLYAKASVPAMKMYLIEREIPGLGKMTPEELKAASRKSCDALRTMGSNIEWVQSYVTGDKMFCIYRAENEDLIREHGKRGGFPVNKITEVTTIISPQTAER
ncbi:DUF4242 domain-containing protein [Flavihumibacter petaseus]|uniref:DUF4242 domain-containing protein n=1 Tax=Flavihumibacter petaseus NBRC 106054 TaxID=1220578 RepID=A0A0E9N5V4_9BACT|nr:DUF4242 domain-containing protein [Flavihumibacter petaseus]GAO45183.1 hypothetical protein FPE01S_04_04270 [Flavihumibacter petaseus NBRC 106054]